jgi:hypothetical protein
MTSCKANWEKNKIKMFARARNKRNGAPLYRLATLHTLAKRTHTHTTGKLGFAVRLERTAKARKIEAHSKGHTTP